MDIKRRPLTDFELSDALMQRQRGYGCVNAALSNGGELYVSPEDVDPATWRIVTMMLGDRVTIVFDDEGRLHSIKRDERPAAPRPLGGIP